MKRRSNRLTFLAACILAAISGTGASAWAQIPGSLVPGRQNLNTPSPAPRAAAGAAAVRPQTPGVPEQARTITFRLKEITLEGAQALPAADMAKLWAPFLNKTISVAKLYEIANSITQYYADAGYALSFAFIPEQTIDDGSVTIRVVEGFIDRIVFTKNGEHLDKIPDRISRMASKLLNSKPLRNADLERYLLLMNDQPGISATSRFAASKTTPNASTMTIHLDHKRVNASASMDNFLPSSLGYTTLGGGIGASFTPENLGALRLDGRCGLSGCNVYNSQVLSWASFMGSEGLKISAKASRSSQKPKEGLLEALDFEGGQKSVVFDLSYPLLRSRQKNISIGSSMGFTNGETEIFVGTLTRDKIRTANVFSSFDYVDRTGGVTQARLDLTKGLPGMGATHDADPLRSRVNGSADFTNANIYAVRTQPLNVISPKLNGFSLQTSMMAQAALDNPLLSVSQCYYGGREIGRGYNSGDVSGDHCVMGVAELRYDKVVGGLNTQTYGFGDAGAVWRKKGPIATGEASRTGAQSAGAGVRMFFTPTTQGSIEIAFPMRKSVTEDGTNNPRIFFALNAQF